jgi:hypothetical protein
MQYPIALYLINVVKCKKASEFTTDEHRMNKTQMRNNLAVSLKNVQKRRENIFFTPTQLLMQFSENRTKSSPPPLTAELQKWRGKKWQIFNKI